MFDSMNSKHTNTEKNAVFVVLPKSPSDFFEGMEIYFQTRMKELEKYADKCVEKNEPELREKLVLRLDAVRSVWLDLEGIKEIV
jgi:hypothetical protein